MPPPKTPTSILAARGSWRAKLRDGEPSPPAAAPDAPGWLSEAARQHWIEISAQLEELGVLTRLDKMSLGVLAESLAQYLDSKVIIERDGVTQKTEKGYVIMNPAAATMHRAFERFMKLAREFGLTPAARANLSTRPVKKADEKRSLLKIG